jgi:membrane fusion protein, multidrug efflux system
VPSKFFAFVSRQYERYMPGFWLDMKPKYQASLGILAVAALWLVTGLFRIGAHATEADGKNKIADRPTVRISEMTAVPHDAVVSVRGNTEALNQVDVRAEVDGVVDSIPVQKGDRVRKGAVLCVIRVNDRAARMAQANAQLAQSAKELDVARELYKDGFRSKTQMAQTEATYESSKAATSAARVALDNTRVRAPFDGIVDDRYVNPGDYLTVGGKCAMVIAPEPFLAVGTVSEDEVGQIAVGNPATVTLTTGETVQGKVRFVANHSEQSTRAFRVEVELPNPQARLRTGISADIRIPVNRVSAYKISPGILVLDDSGAVGVRMVTGGSVKFVPVHVISDGPDGMWVAGLPPRVSVITVGQEFVSDGEKVKAVAERKAGKAQ